MGRTSLCSQLVFGWEGSCLGRTLLCSQLVFGWEGSCLGGTFTATVGFWDSAFFHTAIGMVLRCILSVIFFTIQDSNFNPVPPM